MTAFQTRFTQETPRIKNLYDLPPEEEKNIPTICSSLEQALETLDSDKEFLLQGDVFSEDMINAYIDLKMEDVTRLRMTTLYQIAASNNGIVVGTGNKVEDFGIGFYTKYGDGGVDISPIADCLKTEVWDIGKELGINQEIIEADPTDGLWTDGRTDEQQVGFKL